MSYMWNNALSSNLADGEAALITLLRSKAQLFSHSIQCMYCVHLYFRLKVIELIYILLKKKP